MAVTFNKDKNLKYTDMCIYIDENMPKVVEVGKYPEIESKIYEYLFVIIYIEKNSIKSSHGNVLEVPPTACLLPHHN